MEPLLIFKLFLLGWFISEFSPIQDLFNLYIKPILQPNNEESWINLVKSYLQSSVSCHKCLSFWIALIVTQDVFTAIAASFLASVFQRLFNAFKTYL